MTDSSLPPNPPSPLSEGWPEGSDPQALEAFARELDRTIGELDPQALARIKSRMDAEIRKRAREDSPHLRTDYPPGAPPGRGLLWLALAGAAVLAGSLSLILRRTGPEQPALPPPTPDPAPLTERIEAPPAHRPAPPAPRKPLIRLEEDQEVTKP